MERSVSPRMIEIIKEADRNNDLCGFFPVWGAGEFLHRLIEATCARETIAKAEVHLSHPMRLRRVLRKSGVTSAGVDRHMAASTRSCQDRRRRGFDPTP